MPETHDPPGNVEIEPLSDEELEGMPGGSGAAAGSDDPVSSYAATCSSCHLCSSGEPDWPALNPCGRTTTVELS